MKSSEARAFSSYEAVEAALKMVLLSISVLEVKGGHMSEWMLDSHVRYHQSTAYNPNI